MPTYTYICSDCRVSMDEMFRSYEESPENMTCFCGSEMSRGSIYQFRLVGPIFHDLMQIEKQLLGNKGLQSGKRIRGKKDVEKWEREHKLVRCTAKEERMGREYYADTRSQQEDIVSREGKDAWYEHCDRGDIKDITGWTEPQYQRWRSMNNAEQTRINNGTSQATRGHEHTGTDSSP